MSLNDTPRANRLHIGIYGKRNSGKSSLINALTGQDIALVSAEAGTTTDPVFKSMELHPIGPVVFIDTAGFDDEGELGRLRVKRTQEVLDKTDVAVLVIDGTELESAVQSGKSDKLDKPDKFDKPDESVQTAKHFSDDASGKFADAKRQSTGCDGAYLTRTAGAELVDKRFSDDAADRFASEKQWIKALEEKDVPVIIAVNKIDAFVENEGIDIGEGWFDVQTGRMLSTPEDRAGNDNPDGVKDDAKGGMESRMNDSKEDGTFASGAGGHSAVSRLLAEFPDLVGEHPLVAVSAAEKKGIAHLRKAIEQAVPEDFLREKILGDLVESGSLVMLVMPQDIQAPKGRLILPQVQTLRELLDQKCTAIATTADGFERALAFLQKAPELIITDSQCFNMVYQKKPAESALTSFSVLFAAYKGDIEAFLKGASSLDNMTEKSRVLIAEACTHVPLSEDIGREKIPQLLHKKFGKGLEIVNVCGNDFPELAELKRFDLVIHCGACMFNRKHVLNRIAAAQAAGVPITNYGIVLAKLAGILDKIQLPQQERKGAEQFADGDDG